MPLLGRCTKAALYFAAPSRKILVSSAKNVKEEMLKEEEDLEAIHLIAP
jgi:hypothetical protein